MKNIVAMIVLIVAMTAMFGGFTLPKLLGVTDGIALFIMLAMIPVCIVSSVILMGAARATDAADKAN